MADRGRMLRELADLDGDANAGLRVLEEPSRI
jgi:hypothetical protein